MRGSYVCGVYVFLCFSNLPIDTSTITHTHIWQANLMFAFRQTAVVGFSRISNSSSSQRRTWHHFFIPHASFQNRGGTCRTSLESLLLTPTSEPGHLFLPSTRHTKHVSAWNPGACVRQQKHHRVLVLTLIFKSASRGLHFSEQSWLFLLSGLLKWFTALLSNLLCPYFLLHRLQI